MADNEETEQDTFDRAYVEKLRAEAAKYRTALRPFEDAFGDFNDAEKEFLFGMLKELNQDPQAGAVQFRDMAKNILRDKFYEGLDDAPVGKEETKEETEEEGGEVSLTEEQLKKILEEHDRAAQEAQEEAAREAAAEGVFKEIEAQGFTRGSEEFQACLMMANAQVEKAQREGTEIEVDFATIAPKVRVMYDLPEPEAGEGATEGEGQEGGPESGQSDEVDAQEVAREYAKTASAGGSGAAGEPQTDWIAEAKEEGRSPMEVARERMEARLGGE